ncbi:RNA polymerase sigma factor [Pinibacter aurantiacus]|uniref:Sigma-70 family RNA polymerase sigma factor n=1 Tax=Pinibacter aurantiacus TaxID=2851599 RepID=A0A9E2SAB2_9BACT|nr:sigma-70 family RNA polymerase sigma factor [Pinibacter aurantiacus]MBV4358497.1 sigma-70 family RNA polymerase sigma factor [Pinibacter aurantiacus]
MNDNRFQHIADSSLLENFYKDRNNKWLGILLERYTMLLFGVCMKYLKDEDEAKDATQQVFLKAITELQKYKVDYFKSWLYMVAKNHCLMQLRNAGKIPVSINENMPLPSDEPAVEQMIEKEKTYNRLQEALTHLSKEQQQCVTLFYLEKKSYQQIADDTGFSLMQVKSFIQNGKRNLKLMLESNNTRK